LERNVLLLGTLRPPQSVETIHRIHSSGAPQALFRAARSDRPGPRNALASAGCGGPLNKAYAEYRGIKTAFGLLAKADDLNTIKQRERRAARNSACGARRRNCAYHTHKLLQATAKVAFKSDVDRRNLGVRLRQIDRRRIQSQNLGVVFGASDGCKNADSTLCAYSAIPAVGKTK
jgi:hypothetical protein